MEILEIIKILERNKRTPFVKRVLNPEQYPKLDLGEGNYATHGMRFDTTETGRHIVYPTVIPDKRGEMKMLPAEKAMDTAIRKGNFILFEDPKKADEFAKEYKKYWELLKAPTREGMLSRRAEQNFTSE
jgi:hypothetical protein